MGNGKHSVNINVSPLLFSPRVIKRGLLQGHAIGKRGEETFSVVLAKKIGKQVSNRDSKRERGS